MTEGEDMSLGDFMELCSAKSSDVDTWEVEITLSDLSKSTLTVYNCHSEYEAKERSYLYLKEKIRMK